MASIDRRGGGGSFLVIEELFSSQDERFVEQLRRFRGDKSLAGLASRWLRDPRPWARDQMFVYLDQPLNCPGHHPLVKRLFKHAEKSGDDTLMAAFLVAFDRSVRRRRRTRWRYNWERRESYRVEELYMPRNAILNRTVREVFDPYTGQRYQERIHYTDTDRLFSAHTRYYLRRRSWRYFRRMGFQRPGNYVEAICRALVLYTDDDLDSGEAILDSWGLAHACFGAHEGLRYTASSIRLARGRSMAEIGVAPRFAELWQAEPAAGPLLSLLMMARCRLVRVFAMQLLRQHHQERLTRCTADELLRLLDHDDPEVQAFGAELLQDAPGLATLTMDTWMRLLETRNLLALTAICEAMERHVSEQRLTLGQAVELACRPAAPVARFGFKIIKEKHVVTNGDRVEIARLAEAQCEALGAELCGWALSILGAEGVYDGDVVVGFFDSLLSVTRMAAWSWLGPDSAGWDDPLLWSRLVETPFDDLRLRLVEALDQRVSLPGAGADRLSTIWCTVLLGVHRGGRQKLRAVRQLARTVAHDPSVADTLIPVLAVAVRSVRAPEARAGLAALVATALSRPRVQAVAAEHLPELDLMLNEEVVA